MIRIDRFTLDADTFAAERRKILERSDARFMDAVRASLTRLGLPRWEDNIVAMALDIFEETARSEVDQWNPILDDMRDEFERELRATLAKTKPVGADQFDSQVERMTRWLSTYSVNAGTEGATTSDTDTQVGLEWVTMGDNDVRHTHVEANGETVPSGLPFEVGGFELLYPGQPVGPPEIWINCRCVARPTMLEGFKVKTQEFTSEDRQTVDQLPDSPDSPDSPGFTSEPTAVVAAADPAPVEDPAPMVPLEEEYEPVPWYGVLAPEGAVSGDGRGFTDGGLRMRDLPLPLKWMPEDAEGHDKSQVSGRIDRIFRENGLIKAEGFFDTSFAAYEAIRQIAEGSLRGVSVDIDDMQASLSEDGSSSTATGRICSATLCAIPAFAEAFVALGTWADDPGLVPGGSDIPDGSQVSVDQQPDPVAMMAVSRETFAPVPIKTKDGPGWITDPQPTHRITDYWVDGPGAIKIGWGMPGDFNRCRVQLVKYVQNPQWLAGLCANLHYRALRTWPGQHNGRTQTMGTPALTASAGETLPVDWFKDPNLSGPTPFTVTEDGRVFGHVATWAACHIGQPMTDDDCTTAPHSATGYSYFLTGEVLTDVGPVAVGQITMGGGHAADRAGVRAAVSHYDSTSTAVADVTAGEDEHGIWVAGALRSTVTDDQVHALRAAAISGDWRRVSIGREGNLEMVAALAVNVPGFPIPRPSMLVASGGEPLTLVAAAIPLHDGQDAGDSLEIPTSPVEKFNATRAKFRQLQVEQAKSVFAVSE